MDLPIQVVEQDRHLQATIDKTGQELAALRWHWTRNPQNPELLTPEEYGKKVGKSGNAIRESIDCYAKWLADPSKPFSYYVERRYLDPDVITVIEALSAESGLAFNTTRINHRGDLPEVLDQVRRKAERDNVDIETAAKEIAAFHQRAADARAERRAEIRTSHGTKVLKVDDRIVRATALLRDAIYIAKDLQLGADEREILEGDLGKLGRTIDVAMRVIATGQVNADLDAELAELKESA